MDRWTLPDLLDLEFLLTRDSKNGIPDSHLSEELIKRDRQIFLQAHEECREERMSEQEMNSCLLRLWVEKMRDLASTPLPGQLFSEALRLGMVIVALLCFVSGWLAASSILDYSGARPVNAGIFFLLFVLLQLMILAIPLLTLAIKHIFAQDPFPISVSLAKKFIFFIIHQMVRFRRDHLPDQQQITIFMSRIKDVKKGYAILFMLPFFRITQTGALCFNLGVLLTLILRVTGTDLAFGWESTLQFSSSWVHRLVELFASPWAWLLPEGHGYPTLQQIQESRIVLKEGIGRIPMDALRSWWPFLALSVFFYGILPRLLLIIASLWIQGRMLKRQGFNTALEANLIRRMKTPMVSTHSPETGTRTGTDPKLLKRNRWEKRPSSKTEGQETVDHSKSSSNKVKRTEETKEVRDGTAVFMVIPGELRGLVQEEQLILSFQRVAGLSTAVHPIYTSEEFCDPAEQAERISRRISSPGLEKGQIHLVLVQEAWQPPINEFMRFIQTLKNKLHPDSLITIALIGKPDPQGRISSPSETEIGIWHKKVMNTGDPYLDLLTIPGNGY